MEIPDLKPPHAFGIAIVSIPHAFGFPVQRTPPCPRNSERPSMVWYGYFLEPAIWGGIAGPYEPVPCSRPHYAELT